MEKITYSRFVRSSILALFLAALVIISPTPKANAASLTYDQVQAILNLLQSFGADAGTIANVQTALTGTPSGKYVALEELPGNPTVSCILPDLQVGSRQNSVYLLQTVLKKGGYYPEGLITGYYGPLTQKAINAWRSAAPNQDINSLVKQYYPNECGTPILAPIPMPPYYPTSTQPSIYSIYPTSVPADNITKVTLYGSSFISGGSQLVTITGYSDDGTGYDSGPNNVSVSSDGTQITFTISSSMKPGTYSVQVETIGGSVPTSNSVKLRVNSSNQVFTPTSSLTVTYPTTGASFAAGGTINITFTGYTIGAQYQVTLIGKAYEYKLGLVTAPSADQYKGSFTLPNSISTDNSYQIRVDPVGKGNSAYSGFFTITGSGSAQSSINVTYPQAGYALDNSGGKDSGLIANITWASANVGNFPIEIDLLNTSGVNVKTIGLNIQNTGTYAWRYDLSIPNGTYKILISTQTKEGPNMAAGASGYFTLSGNNSGVTIGQPTIVVTSDPAFGNTSVALGQVMAKVASYKLTNSSNEDIALSGVSLVLNNNAGKFSNLRAQFDAQQFQVGTVASSLSSGTQYTFSISGSSVIIPTGSSYVLSVYADVSQNSTGGDMGNLASWVSCSGVGRITGKPVYCSGTPVGQDVRILGSASTQPSITVLSPNGGESYVAGSSVIHITYQSANIAQQLLTAYLYNPTLGNVRSITTYANDSGSVDMDLGKGNTIDQAGQYKITICDNSATDPSSGKTLCDSSDNYFTIASAP